jgi:SpoVK/Ycf46/Vps4 family AAA+-type ATPase
MAVIVLLRLVEMSEKEPRIRRGADLPRDRCVLFLGDPGTGKTASFRDAAAANPGDA